MLVAEPSCRDGRRRGTELTSLSAKLCGRRPRQGTQAAQLCCGLIAAVLVIATLRPLRAEGLLSAIARIDADNKQAGAVLAGATRDMTKKHVVARRQAKASATASGQAANVPLASRRDAVASDPKPIRSDHSLQFGTVTVTPGGFLAIESQSR